MTHRWDFFLAHSSADKDTALFLFELLKKKARVFLDSERLLPGDDWDSEL